jgi:hypothetical protein
LLQKQNKTKEKMSKHLTADKAFGESMHHAPSKVEPSVGQLEGQEKTEQDVRRFLQELFPQEQITPQNYKKYYKDYLSSLGIR